MRTDLNTAYCMTRRSFSRVTAVAMWCCCCWDTLHMEKQMWQVKYFIVNPMTNCVMKIEQVIKSWNLGVLFWLSMYLSNKMLRVTIEMLGCRIWTEIECYIMCWGVQIVKDLLTLQCGIALSIILNAKWAMFVLKSKHEVNHFLFSSPLCMMILFSSKIAPKIVVHLANWCLEK